MQQDVSNHTERQSPRPQRQHEQSPEPFLNHPSGGEVGASEASAAIRSVPAPDLQPPNALFNSHNVLISGGQFNNSRGHQTTNLTINLNQSAIDSPSTDDEPNVSEQAETIHHTVRIPKRQPLTLESDLRRAPELQKSNIIYEGQLAVKGRGYPLWIPNPNKRLPMPYRRRGIGIGDVGIITAFGGFDFLFNICLPRDHPINPRTLPENFYPIDPPIEAIDIHGFSEYMPGSSIASASVSKLQSDRRVSGLSFESSAQEGAILAMPEGANSEELENFGRFREYAAANVEHWYEFVNGPRGREAKNGDIRLVVGCDKSTAWGIAIFANHTQQQNDCRLTFSAAVEPSGGVIGRTYSWAYSGMAEVRAGPDPREVNELKQGDGTRNASSDDGYENQCLFVRTLNITMRDNVWAKFKARSDPLHAHGERSATNYHRNAAQSIARPSNFGDVSNTGAFQSHGVSGNQRSAAFPTDLQDGGAVEHSPAVLISGPPTTLVSAVGESLRRDQCSLLAAGETPSDGINAALLQRDSNAICAITHDMDWYSVIKDDDSCLPGASELVTRILSSNKICKNNGVVYLEPKQTHEEKPETASQLPSIHSSQVTVVEAQAMFPPSKLGEYTVIQDIAEGTFGTVKMAKHTVTGRTVAMKSVSKALFYSPYNSVAPEEFGYMRTFQHPHIIRIYEVISTPTHFILVLEYAPGELFNYIVTHGRMDVPLARKLLHQMISAIETMYHLEYLHLDLKPGNILLDDNLNLKITDFGVSNYIVDFHNLLTRRASEVVRGTVYATPQCDVWSSGVILYVMLCGKLPFENGNVQVPFSKMSKGTLHLPSHLSEDARTLITSMLAVDPVKRITIPNIVQHPFFTTDLPHHAPPPWRFKQYTGYKKPSFSRSLQESKAPEVKSIEDLGKEVVDELAHSMIGVNGDEIWQCLLSDDVQGNSVKVAYMLLQDKNTLLRDKKKQLRRDPWEYAEANYRVGDDTYIPLSLESQPSDGKSQLLYSKFGKSRFEDKINVEYEDIDPEDDPPESISSPISNESETNFGILHTSLPQQSPENVLEQHHLASYFLANRSGAQEKQKPRTKWHFGIRSTSPPMHVMLEIYRTLKTLGMEWKEKTDLGGLGGVYSKPAGLKGGDVDGEPREPINFKAASCIYFVETRARVQDVVLLMDLQLYMIDSSNYLVDFHHKKSYQANTAPGAGKFDLAPKNSASSRVSNDASPLGKDKERDSLETMHEDEVTSPYIFLDVTSRLILELAGGGE